MHITMIRTKHQQQNMTREESKDKRIENMHLQNRYNSFSFKLPFHN